MKMRWMMGLGIIGLLAMQGRGQSLVIASFQGNGWLSWTNSINTNAYYRTEWAAQADGPWHAFSYQPINAIDAHNSTSFGAEVPMFYRVVVMTNEPPWGMVWIDGGDVELGQESIATPVHTSFVSGFWMDAKEVPAWQWQQVHGWATNHGYTFENEGMTHPLRVTYPVYGMNWYDCLKWCNARSEKEGLSPAYYTDFFMSQVYRTGNVNIVNSWVAWLGNGYRLPTEAEWEKAARGGRQRKLFPWGGDTIQHERATYFATGSYSYDTSPTLGISPLSDGLTPGTTPVGSLPPNGYGVYDMAGNVWEWCWDWMSAYSSDYSEDPKGPSSGSEKVVRGGDSNMNAPYTRCAHRANSPPDMAASPPYIGFRCVRRQ